MHIFNKRWLTVGLYPFSLLFRLAVTLRNLLYDLKILRRIKLHVPVISIGNITIGGTGKTPAVEYFVRWLLTQNLRPAIITRGYGRQTSGTEVVADGMQLCSSVTASGDEAMQLARRLKEVVIIADDRKARGAYFANKHFELDVIVIDDGFQHRRLHRDFDIVLIDAPSFFTNRWLLPAGPFREPFSSLRRANAVILTNLDKAESGEVDTLKALCRQHSSSILLTAILRPLFFENVVSGEMLPLSALQGKKIFAVCGIARPLRFVEGLQKLGPIVIGQQAFPDHHAFTPREIAALVARAVEVEAAALVITEKDATKWTEQVRNPALPILFLRVEFCPTAELTFLQRELLKQGPGRLAHPEINFEIT